MTTELTPSEIRGAVTAARDETSRFLCGLISFPSLSGQEAEVMNYAARRFSEVAEVEAIPLEDSLREDEDYSDPIPGLHYDGRANLRLRVAGQAGGRSLLFNTHLDVVPASAGQDTSKWAEQTGRRSMLVHRPYTAELLYFVIKDPEILPRRPSGVRKK